MITGSGNVLWNPEDDRDLFQLHKGACDHQLDPHHRMYSSELDQWMKQLAHNVTEPLTGRPLPIG